MNALHNSSSGRRFFLGIALFFCLLTGIWLLTDVVFRTIGAESKSTVFETEHVKGRGLVMARRDQLGEGNINEQGLRRKGTLPDPLPEEIRILVLGDSSAWGAGMEIRHAWPTMLEKLLRDEGIPATVMNGAGIGKGFNGIYFDFLWYKKHLAIDLVIIHGWWEHALVLESRLMASEFPTLENARKLFPNWPLSLKPNRHLPIRKIDGSYLEGNYFAPKAIVRLANFSPLARYLNERVFPSIGKVLSQSPEFHRSKENKTSIPKEIKKISANLQSHFSKETFQFFTGLILREAALSSIPVITVRPMSVLRIPGILETDFWEQFQLEAFNLFRKDYKELREQIEILDSVIDLFSETNHTLVIDPQRDFFDNVDLRNISTIQKLFTDHNHFHVAGNMLLAKFIKRELSNRGFLKKISNDPWTPTGTNTDFSSTQ